MMSFNRHFFAQITISIMYNILFTIDNSNDKIFIISGWNATTAEVWCL